MHSGQEIITKSLILLLQTHIFNIQNFQVQFISMIQDSWFNWKAENAGFNSVGNKSAEKRIEKINKYGVKTQVECFVDSLAFHTKNEYLL